MYYTQDHTNTNTNNLFRRQSCLDIVLVCYMKMLHNIFNTVYRSVVLPSDGRAE